MKKLLGRLKDKSLFVSETCLINGKWVGGSSNIDVRNPASGSVIGAIPSMSGQETRMAIDSAQNAFLKWRQVPHHERSKVLRTWYHLLLQNKDDLAEILTAEQGKPLTEAKWEIDYSAAFLEVFADEAKRAFGELVPQPHPNTRIIVSKQPIGVVGAITPWNFPSAMIARKVAAALAAGCTMVLKPSEFTPFSAFAMAKLGERAGIPAGVFNCVTGASEVIGKELTSNPLVRKITFTGSTRVGKILLEQCASTVKRTSMELGGNAPLIVFDDCDLATAVAGCAGNKFRNGGQTCVTTNRIFVQSRVHDDFVSQFLKAATSIKIGDGTEEGVQMGPLINEAAVQKVDSLVKDALSKGGKLLCGGKRAKASGITTNLAYEPTVIIGGHKDMRIFKEEVFGPVAVIFKFDTEDQVIAMSNDTNVGLAAYCYTSNASRQWKLPEQLDYGMVGVNQSTVSVATAPFGGMKESGMGREGSHYGLLDYLDIKAVHIGML